MGFRLYREIRDSTGFVIPPLGALIVFWRPGKLRTMPCPEEWDLMDDEQRSDYAPCGYYWNGRLNTGGHSHWDTGICDEARAWLNGRERESA